MTGAPRRWRARVNDDLSGMLPPSSGTPPAMCSATSSQESCWNKARPRVKQAMNPEVPQIFRTGDPIGFSPERTGSSAGETEALHSGVQGAGRQESGRLLAAANDRRGGAGTRYQRYHARVLG